uniref:Variant surface glycoprotein 817 n=1 Tax=Trypanosoma brucei TaxID=5691 RepID=M4TDY7_9TRYP|nr:variant surface glycoprotein 817 [Trypanosoma brucei]
MEPTLILIALVAALPATSGAQGVNSGETEANAAATEACTMDVYYEAIEKELTRWLEATVSASQEIEAQQQLLRLASAKAVGTPKAIGYEVLAEIAADRSKQAMSETRKMTQPIAEALTAIASRRAATAAILKLTVPQTPVQYTHNANGRGGTVLTQNSGNTAKCDVSAEPAATLKSSCRAQKTNFVDAKKVAAALKTLKTLKVVSSTQLKLPKTTATIEGVGDLSHSTEWNTGTGNKHCNENAAAQAPNAATKAVALTALTYEVTATAKAIDIAETESSQEDEALKAAGDERSWIISDKSLAQAIQAAQTAYQEPQKPLNNEPLIDVAQTAAARAVYDFLTKGTTKRPTEQADAKKVAQLLFGKDTGDVGTEFLKPLESDSNSIPTSDKPITGTTTTIAAENYNEAMAYYYALNLKKTAAGSEGDSPKEDEKTDAAEKKEDKKDGDNKTAEVCTATAAGKCDTTKCTWDKDKNECKVKEGAVVISSVIKAPLLLAFLIQYIIFKRCLLNL